MKYICASGLREAVDAVGSGAKPLAGGTVVVPLLSATGGRGQTIVDIGNIAELAQTTSDGAHLHLGSTVSLARIAADSTIRSGFRAILQAAAAVGNPQVRRAATIGGNVALGAGTADMVPALLALDAEVVCYFADVKQHLPLAHFDATGRLIVGIRVPVREQTRSSFRKFAWRGASGITIVNVAVSVSIDNGLISAPHVVAGGLRRHAERLANAEALLVGQRLTSELAASVAATAAAEAVCELDGPPGERYRRRVLEFGVKETLAQVMNS